MLFQREIEKKFVLDNTTYDQARRTLEKLASYIMAKDETSSDIYWKHPTVDFIRLRENSKELTVKVTDKSSIVDRIEENIEIKETSMEAAERANTLLYGPPVLKLTKRFSVYGVTVRPAPGTAYTAILCLYQVKGDPKERVFFEVEASTIKAVDEVISYFNWTNLTQENRSLFQIFHGDK